MVETVPDVAVIIINYGTADLAIAAVESVLSRDHGGRSVAVHLLDNASPGGDAAVLAERHARGDWAERVTLWPEPVNHGFGRGNNRVLAALATRNQVPRHVFLLNPDAALRNEAIDLLAQTLDARPEVAVVGAGIALPSGKPVTAAFRFPSPLSEFVQAVNFGPLARAFRRHLIALPPDQPEGPVDWVAGAAVLFRGTVLQSLGGFDPDFFLYYEEVELMHRIRAAGHQILYVPRAQVTHAEGAATQVKSHARQRRPRPAYWYRSWQLYYLKTAGRGGAIRAGLAWFAGALLNLPVALLRGQPLAAPKGFYVDFPRLAMWPLIRGKKAAHD